MTLLGRRGALRTGLVSVCVRMRTGKAATGILIIRRLCGREWKWRPGKPKLCGARARLCWRLAGKGGRSDLLCTGMRWRQPNQKKISKPYPVYAPVDTPAPRTRLFYQQERLALEAKRREFSAALRRRLAEKKETIAQAKRALAIEEQEAALEAELEIHKQRLLLKQKKKEEQLRHLRELAEAWNPKPTPILPFPPLSPERMTPELEELMRQAEAFRELGRR